MPLRFQISPQNKLATVTGEGAGGFADFVSVMDQVAEDPSFSSEFDVIADFRKLDYSPSFKEIRRFASEFSRVRAALPPRVGIVVRDRLQLRLGRFAAMLAKVLRFELSVFDDLQEATRWIQQGKAGVMSDVIAKILQVWEEPQLAALATLTPQGKPWVRYVVTTATDDLTIRFATARESRKVEHIAANPEVHLVTGAPSVESARRWVQIEGRAEMSSDDRDRKLVWHDGLKAFFDGPDDQTYVVGLVHPYRIEYMEMSFSKPEVWQP